MPEKSPTQIEAEIEAALRGCSLSVVGFWTRMRHLIEQSDGRPGDLRLRNAPEDAEELAILAGASAAKVPGLLLRLTKTGLVRRLPDGALHSPLLARLIEVRRHVAERVARHRAKTGKRALRNAPRALRNAQKGVTFGECNAHVTNGPSPPPLFPPHTPPLIPTPTPISDAAHRSGDGSKSSGAVSGTAAAAAADGIAMVPIEPKATKFPPGVWRRACEGWAKAWEHVHGVKFIGKKRDWNGLGEVLTALQADVDEFAKVARVFLREPEIGPVKGHPLPTLWNDLNYYRSKAAKGDLNGSAKAVGNIRHRGIHEELKL